MHGAAKKVSARARWLLLGLGLLPLCCARSVSQADEVDGEWSGRVSLLGNYYWETSTRVTAPELNVQLTSPNGTDLSANYLVDTITSASQAATTISRPDTTTDTICRTRVGEPLSAPSIPPPSPLVRTRRRSPFRGLILHRNY